MVDGVYRLSLDVWQVTELGLRNGAEVTEAQLAEWEEESSFGKLYVRALEYTMMRPHSAKEVRDYLWRKTLTRRVRVGAKSGTGEAGWRKKNISSNAKCQMPNSSTDQSVQVVEKKGVSQHIADRVYDRLVERGYVDDEKFARYWLENRSLGRGASRRKLIAELRAKGVAQSIIEPLLATTLRDDGSELRKIIAKKSRLYTDPQKLTQYLMRQGFGYDDIRAVLAEPDN